MFCTIISNYIDIKNYSLDKLNFKGVNVLNVTFIKLILKRFKMYDVFKIIQFLILSCIFLTNVKYAYRKHILILLRLELDFIIIINLTNREIQENKNKYTEK